MGSRRTYAALRRRAGIGLAVWAVAFGMLAVAAAIPGGPKAVLTVSTTAPTVGETVLFNASASQGHDQGNGRIVAYLFAFGDGASTPWQSSPLASHAYAAAGTYVASVTVQDRREQEGSAAVTLHVTSSPPPVTQFPDLRPIQASLTPAEPALNDSVALTVIVLNHGALAATSAVLEVTDLLPNGSRVVLNVTRLPVALAPAATESVAAATFVAGPEGNHTLRITVTDVVPKENVTGDNVLEIPMRVSAPGSPPEKAGPPAFDVTPLVLGLAAAGVAAVAGAAFLLLRRPPRGPLEPPPPTPPDQSPPPIFPP